jgi:hypothetical protein
VFGLLVGEMHVDRPQLPRRDYEADVNECLQCGADFKASAVVFVHGLAAALAVIAASFV